MTEKWLALELSTPSGEKTHVVMEILRCRPVELLYEIAGKFVSMFTTYPAVKPLFPDLLS